MKFIKHPVAVTFSLAISCLASTAFAQTVSCGAPATTQLPQFNTSPSTWTVAGPIGPQPNRTTPPASTPPAGNNALVAATPIDVPPNPPTDPDGYRWDPALSWVGLTADGRTSSTPNYFYFKQTVTLDSLADPAQFSLSYDVSADDELWAIYVNGTMVQGGTARMLQGFNPVRDAGNYRNTQPLPVTLPASSGWRAGANEIVFAVYDFGGYSGFASVAKSMNLVCQNVAVANPDTYTVPLTGGPTPTVVSNDTVNGQPVVLGPNGNATVVPGTGPVGMTMDPATGIITVPPGTAPGSYPFPYQICPVNGGACVSATATVTVSATATPADVTPVPVDDWRALAALAALLAGFSVWQIRRRSH